MSKLLIVEIIIVYFYSLELKVIFIHFSDSLKSFPTNLSMLPFVLSNILTSAYSTACM